MNGYGNFLHASVLVVILGVGLEAKADNSAWYLGVSGGVTSADDSQFDNVEESGSDDSSGWKLYAGYDINDIWAVELGYTDLGELDGPLANATGMIFTTAFSEGISIPVEVFLASDFLVFGPESLIAAASHSISYEPSLWELSVLGKYPMGDRFSLFGKLGLSSWELESDYEGLSKRPDESGTDVFVGLGCEYGLSDKFSVRAAWDRYAIDSADVDLWSVGIVFHL